MVVLKPGSCIVRRGFGIRSKTSSHRFQLAGQRPTESPCVPCSTQSQPQRQIHLPSSDETLLRAVECSLCDRCWGISVRLRQGKLSVEFFLWEFVATICSSPAASMALQIAVLSNCSASSSLITPRSCTNSPGSKLLVSSGYCPSSLKRNPIAFRTSTGGLSLVLSVGQRRIVLRGKGSTVMRWGGGKENSSDSSEERPETLFMRELAKRKKLGQDVGVKETDTKTKGEDDEKSGDSASTKVLDDTADQRKRSMALNSEGLDGLVPRGGELVKLGGSFWLSLWPLIAASLLAFAAAYLYFGPAFVHSGTRATAPPYVDPYQLLESEQLPYQVGPNRVPYNNYRSPQ